ncbi:methyltransferase domain-containing protein [Lentisphaerota bacterium ZTH]|nr:methyltransferase domain-containing protein [Lentisphaerota bacterium]WET07261.1 methyltransferase domain-containing protein [Lentisphaerota bacterium ZTH]
MAHNDYSEEQDKDLEPRSDDNNSEMHGLSLCHDDIIVWIVDRLPLHLDMKVLDVALPAGALTRCLARYFNKIDALNYPGSKACCSKGCVKCRSGIDSALPFENEAFDLVVSRFEMHHCRDYCGRMKELTRVCRKNGWVAVCDIICENPDLYDEYNSYERLRADNHVSCLTSEKLQQLFCDAGLFIVRNESRDLSVNFEKWFDSGSASDDISIRNKILKDMLTELKGGRKTGLQPYIKHGSLFFFRKISVIVGKKY